MTEITQVPVALIDPGPNDRKRFDPVKLQQLADSIAKNSDALVIALRPSAGGRFQIVYGERRFRAVRDLLGWETIPAIVRAMSDEEASAVMLSENTARADLDPIEEATGYQQRIDCYGWTVQRLAEIAGRTPDLVKARLSLLRLVPEIQQLVATGQFPIGHAEALVDLDTNRQRIALRIYNEGKGLTLRQFRHIVDSLLSEQNQDSLFDLAEFWVHQVQACADLPRRGKRAYTGAPTRPDLPPVRTEGSKDTAASVIDRYIADLVAAGQLDAAGAIGTLYNSLVQMNFLSVPERSLLRTEE